MKNTCTRSCSCLRDAFHWPKKTILWWCYGREKSSACLRCEVSVYLFLYTVSSAATSPQRAGATNVRSFCLRVPLTRLRFKLMAVNDAALLLL